MQREFGALVGYSRTAVANAETGHARIGRPLWERADRVLGTGELFAHGFDRIQAQASAASRASATLPPASGSWPAGTGCSSPDGLRVAEHRKRCGWRAGNGAGPLRRIQAGRLWLVTGTVIDALGGAAGGGDGGGGLVAVHPGRARRDPGLARPARPRHCAGSDRGGCALLLPGPLRRLPMEPQDADGSGAPGTRPCAGMPMAAGCWRRRRYWRTANGPRGRTFPRLAGSWLRRWRYCTCWLRPSPRPVTATACCCRAGSARCPPPPIRSRPSHNPPLSQRAISGWSGCYRCLISRRAESDIAPASVSA